MKLWSLSYSSCDSWSQNQIQMFSTDKMQLVFHCRSGFLSSLFSSDVSIIHLIWEENRS